MNIIDWLKGKKTYLVAILGFIYGGGIYIGLWDHSVAIDALLASAGLATVRAGIAKATIEALLVCALVLTLTGCISSVRERPTEFGLERTTFRSCLMIGSASKIRDATKDGDYSRTISIGQVQGQGDTDLVKELGVAFGQGLAAGAKTALKP